MSTPNCRGCGRTLLVGEEAWADDWTVITPGGAYRETRFTCDDCQEAQVMPVSD